MIDLASGVSCKMQKYLKFLSFRLDVVVKDVCGLTGLKIIDDICKGNLDPFLLAEHRHYNCRKSKEEIAMALHGNNREDFLFGLKQEYLFLDQKRKLRIVSRIKKNIAKFDLNHDDIGFSNSQIINANI